MLFLHDNGTIKLTRGDTASLTVAITDVAGENRYELSDGDTLTMSVKHSINDSDYCFQKKVIGASVFHILPEDTRDMRFGRYKYDVQLTTDGGDVCTIIGPCTFELLEEVTV